MLQTVALDQRGIGCDARRERLDLRLRGVHALCCRRPDAHQLREAREIQASVVEARLILALRGFSLPQLRGERALVQLREELPRLHILPFRERDARELPVDPHFHIDCVERLDRSHRGEANREVE
ncbi:hypothetical protein ABH944_001540 [Caballeronia udeis]|uniref:Uncharacterized protein n=1 Tax=Caballeronia udeis TaxID=1232866 RepID=A0ABW8MDZ7_9BURK